MDSPLQVAIGLVWWNGRLAVGRRRRGQALEDHDEFPGGKCLPEEPPHLAVARECHEEIGALVLPIGLRSRARHDYDHARLELFFFDCVLVDERSTTLREPFEWWPLNRVLSGRFPPANRQALELLTQFHLRVTD